MRSIIQVCAWGPVLHTLFTVSPRPPDKENFIPALSYHIRCSDIAQPTTGVILIRPKFRLNASARDLHGPTPRRSQRAHFRPGELCLRILFPAAASYLTMT